MCYVKASHLNQSTFIKNSFENTYSSYLQNRALPNHLHELISRSSLCVLCKLYIYFSLFRELLKILKEICFFVFAIH